MFFNKKSNSKAEKIQCFLTIMFLLIYPLMVLQFKHHGIWVCINLNHAAHFLAIFIYPPGPGCSKHG